MKGTILIVDDVPKNLQVIGSHLSNEGYELVMATSGEAALKAVKEEPPDLILLDINMPGIDGYQVCKKLKASEEYKDIPIIFLTARADKEDLVQGFEAGAVDYVTKPFNKSELIARVKTHIELYKLKQELIRISLTDPLTKLENRRSIAKFFDQDIKGAFILLSDIDNFKSINDTYGHDCGDLVLKTVSKEIKNNLREEDRVGRWGGEEFLIILPGTSIDEGRIIAEKIRSSIENLAIKYNNNSIPVTMTFGSAEYNITDSADKVIMLADNALYEGKSQGKNRVI